MKVRTGALKGCVTSTLKVKATLPAVDSVTDKIVSIKSRGESHQLSPHAVGALTD